MEVLAKVTVYRDRERSVARYNEFRRALLLVPIKKWEDLRDDDEAIEILKEVYGDDVEELDILVGLMAEKKIIGFASSAFSVWDSPPTPPNPIPIYLRSPA
ncbi:hypothetical protein L484_005831 [Morus notabilis]|uniref:Uncharacterized protein n=1 Tax=Morus notabilis TaxID=981085 RepID=W9RZ42_9ROSA|nr:hypothetical protein L484_005831 [Morus notabilis]